MIRSLWADTISDRASLKSCLNDQASLNKCPKWLGLSEQLAQKIRPIRKMSQLVRPPWRDVRSDHTSLNSGPNNRSFLNRCPKLSGHSGQSAYPTRVLITEGATDPITDQTSEVFEHPNWPALNKCPIESAQMVKLIRPLSHQIAFWSGLSHIRWPNWSAPVLFLLKE